MSTLSQKSDLVRVVSYCRVSTEEQAKGYSLEAQKEAIRRVCSEKGWEYIADFTDAGISGAAPLEERPGLQKLLFAAGDHDFDMVLVHNVDRLSRSNLIFWQVIEKLKEYGVKFAWSESPEMDSFKNEFPLIAAMLSGQSEYFRKNLIQKTKLGMDLAKKQGKFLGRPPHGFYIDPEGRLAPDELGMKALEILRLNPKLKPKLLQQDLRLESYWAAWKIKKVCLRIIKEECLTY